MTPVIRWAVKSGFGYGLFKDVLAADAAPAGAVEMLHAIVGVWWVGAVRANAAEAIGRADRSRASMPSLALNLLRFGVYFLSKKDNSAT